MPLGCNNTWSKNKLTLHWVELYCSIGSHSQQKLNPPSGREPLTAAQPHYNHACPLITTQTEKKKEKSRSRDQTWFLARSMTSLATVPNGCTTWSSSLCMQQKDHRKYQKKNRTPTSSSWTAKAPASLHLGDLMPDVPYVDHLGGLGHPPAPRPHATLTTRTHTQSKTHPRKANERINRSTEPIEP